MSRTMRLWLVVVPLGLAAGAGSFAVTVTSDHIDVPRLTAVLVLLTGWSFIAAGLIARTRRPHNRTGLLMIAVGFGWFAGAPYAANDSLLWTIGVALSAVAGGFLIHLLLAYPSGRLGSRWERGLVAVGYLLTTFAMLPVLLIDRTPVEGCEECPNNAFLVDDSPTAAGVATAVIEVLAVVFLLATVATLARRWRTSSPAARRVLTPVLLAGGATLLLFAVSVGTQSMWLTFSTVTAWAAMLVLIEVPFLFLWGLLQSRLARADIGRALADGLAGGAPGWVRQLLHDPAAEVLYARAPPAEGYVDAMGRPRDPADEEGRAVTRIERKGRPLAAIVHDSALLEEPELLEQVAAAVGLEVERDKSLFALQASERRSRALIDAMPDNMFRISADGIFLDIQENPASELGPVQSKIGSSVYDYPVERQLVERVIAAGRRALETGELQTIEWELGEPSDLRHQEGRFMPSGPKEFFLVVRDVTARKQQELERAALHRVALAVAAESRPEQVFSLVAEEIGRVLGADSANLFRYENDGEEIVSVGRWNVPGAYSEPNGARFPMVGGAAGEIVYTTGQPVRFELVDLPEQSEPAEHMRRMGVDSLVAAPITVSGRIWGVIAARLTPPHKFARGVEERLGAFTRLVSLAVANEEARAELAASRARLVSAGDEERRRLERNLHDGAQQRLVSLSLSLRLAQAKLASDPEGGRELLNAAGVELNLALEELRELARGIHPAVLTERGLTPALESLAGRAPLPVELELPDDGRLPSRVEAAAYYVVSEALANVTKYANASCVTVNVARENGFAVVQVLDDGIGGADPQRGSGLRGLMDRIEALDGTLSVNSRRGQGTRIRAEIPFALRSVPVGE
jgi:signal transduction histidine kinase/PAS domain-containing protein